MVNEVKSVDDILDRIEDIARSEEKVRLDRRLATEATARFC